LIDTDVLFTRWCMMLGAEWGSTAACFHREAVRRRAGLGHSLEVRARPVHTAADTRHELLPHWQPGQPDHDDWFRRHFGQSASHSSVVDLNVPSFFSFYVCFYMRRACNLFIGHFPFKADCKCSYRAWCVLLLALIFRCHFVLFMSEWIDWLIDWLIEIDKSAPYNHTLYKRTYLLITTPIACSN